MVLSFARKSIKHFNTVGTILQSSNNLARSVSKEVKGKNIVELGAGNGVITRALLKRNNGIKSLTAVELLPEFLEDLYKIKDKRLNVLSANALDMELYLDTPPDCIVSGLPFTFMPREDVDKILKQASNYPLFVQYQYNGLFKKRYKEFFSNVKFKRVINFPLPLAYVYVCSNN